MRIDLNDMFNDYIVGKRAAYDAPRGSYNEGYLFGEAHDMENWFKVFGVDLEYWTIQQMITEKAEVRLPLKAGDGRTGLTVSVLHRRDYSGTDDVNVHFSRNSADETVKNEMVEICGKRAFLSRQIVLLNPYF